MKTAIGFTMIWRGTDREKEGAQKSLQRVLSNFPELGQITIEMGDTLLTVWGREDLKDSLHVLPDGSLLALIGAPIGEFSWQFIQESMAKQPRLTDFHLPWDGRVILLHLSPDGDCWTLWNDWMAAVPVFYVENGYSRIASTLEPAVVSAGGLTSADFNMPALVHFIMHGNFLSDWTLYQSMKVVPVDCVIVWDGHGHICHKRDTIQPTEERWQSSWDSLIEELHDLAKKAIGDVFKTQSSWIITLSSGLDSRLIGAVGAEVGANMQAYTWGPSTTKDIFYSQQLAKALEVPWHRVDLGDDYMERYLPQWISLFGSAMHFHGMYQIPFYESLKNKVTGNVISGFIGGPLAGSMVRELDSEKILVNRSPFTIYDGIRFLDIPEMKRFFKNPIEREFEQVADEIDLFRENTPGHPYQKMMKLILWARGARFLSYQLSLADYWRGIEAPYLNREYTRFFYSLPRPLLDGRRLLIEMMKRYYKKVMSVPGTYGNEPAILTGQYLVKRRLAGMLPQQLSNAVLPEFATTRNIFTDVTSLRHSQKKALWPIEETRDLLSQWFDMNMFDEIYQKALGGDMKSIRVLQCVQAVAYRANPNNDVSLSTRL